ncbi:hypothetical protein QF046_003137 [Microbacterium sp. W4I4]|uniref:protein phosphatase 2C domain-containing protein n=1 Tax=Microbacterium sp. W4I4 TaxID=3042295 RepID=UPI002788CEF5|nr:protein phosphatase 2C domain-containing protein [Microbacterium sp. W4I4]MDQ0615496.1 hypothetical protein [Microbacterium sp. W4I4]
MTPELFSLSAEVGQESEDACAIGVGIGVVVDGAGLPASMRKGCSHSVAWYARMLAEELRMRLESSLSSMTDALAGAIAEVTEAHATTCDLSQGSPSATVAAWRIVGDEVEHLVLCDASVVLIGVDGSAREVTDDRITAAVQTRAESLASAAGIPTATAGMRFAALDDARNVEGGFWCAHIDPDAARHALTGRTPISELRAVVAASDGATRGFQLVGAHTLRDFADLAVNGDVARIAAEIRAAEDAHGVPPFTKPHDDIALVSVRF